MFLFRDASRCTRRLRNQQKDWRGKFRNRTSSDSQSDKTESGSERYIFLLNSVPKKGAMLDALKKEEDILQQFSGRNAHPNIVPLLDSYNDIKLNLPVLVLPYFEGGDLIDWIINNEGKIKMGDMQAQTHRIAYELAKGLKVIHEKGICHYDLKPDNILLTSKKPETVPMRSSIVSITDFGLSSYTKEPAKSKGTPGYAPPELLNSNLMNYDCKSGDIFSLGVVFYTLHLAREPFSGNTVAETLSNTVKGSYKLPSVLDPQMAALIKEMLQANPTQRIKLDAVLSHAVFAKVMEQKKSWI